MNLGPKAGASSPHSKRWRAKQVRRNIAKRLECVRLAGAFVGSWSQSATKKSWRLAMNAGGLRSTATHFSCTKSGRRWNAALPENGAHGVTRPTLLRLKDSRGEILR